MRRVDCFVALSGWVANTQAFGIVDFDFRFHCFVSLINVPLGLRTSRRLKDFDPFSALSHSTELRLLITMPSFAIYAMISLQ